MTPYLVGIAWFLEGFPMVVFDIVCEIPVGKTCSWQSLCLM